MNPEWIGYLAAMLTTSAYVPQAVKALRERHTSSISLGMYLMMTLGNAIWFWYGLLIDSSAIIAANTITFMLTLSILLMKIRHG